MNENISFNTIKLNEVYEEMQKKLEEYKDTISSLDLEIKNLEALWGTTNQSSYQSFREKYDEKKNKLLDMENMMKELVNTLSQKKQELEEATIQSTTSFE